MPIDLVTLSAAALTGLLGSLHCLVMCAGVATSLAAASNGGIGHSAAQTAVSLNLGRLLGYTLAGALGGGFSMGIAHGFDQKEVVGLWRLGVGVILILIGLGFWDGRDRLAAFSKIGRRLWQHLQPLTSLLIPADTLPRRLALGALWGWLPCGLSWSMLLAALFSADALHGALLMLAFGLGTLPAVLPLTWGSARFAQQLSQKQTKGTLALLIISAGLITLAAPWLMTIPELHTLLKALGCFSFQRD